jgi:predicted lipoprotein with Yx(FWY)xxD motif
MSWRWPRNTTSTSCRRLRGREQFVGWAKAHLRRAHHSDATKMVGTLAPCPPYELLHAGEGSIMKLMTLFAVALAIGTGASAFAANAVEQCQTATASPTRDAAEGDLCRNIRFAQATCSYRTNVQSCSCPYPSTPVAPSITCGQYVDSNGMSCGSSQCYGSCACQSPPQVRQPDQSPPTDGPRVTTAPSDDDSQLWRPKHSCLKSLRLFNSINDRGAFAVAKFGGCGWSTANGPATRNKSLETMRREAVEQCSQHGVDCKVVSER